MSSDMSPHAFNAALERYGGSLHRWPSALRVRAEALLNVSPAAAAALQRAQSFDRFLLANDPGAGIEAARHATIAHRVMIEIRQSAQQLDQSWAELVHRVVPTRSSTLRFAASLLVAAALGVLAGQQLTHVGDDEETHLRTVTPTKRGEGLAVLFRDPRLTLVEGQ